MTRAEILARWARAHLGAHLGGAPAIAPAEPWAHERGSTFVTLRWRDGRLQGCIGNLDGLRSLADDIAHNAVAAATRDPRGRRLGLADLEALDVEVSILSPLEPIGSEREIRVGEDGVVLAHGLRRATFLPVVWTKVPALEDFMAALREKAGVASAAVVELWRYSVEHHVDHGTSGALVAPDRGRPDPV